MNVHGFWSDKNKKNYKDRSVYAGTFREDLRQRIAAETWRDHPDRDAVERAEKALCLLPKVARHDS